MLYLLHNPLSLGQDFLQHALPVLSTERQEKIARLRSFQDKISSASVFLLLRMALYAQYGIKDMPKLYYTAYGKPFLCNSTLHFSMSACHGAVACALATENIGLDIENWETFSPAHYTRPCLRRFFTAEELPQIYEENDNVYRTAEIQRTACVLWTTKESIVKYTGEGLHKGLPRSVGRTDIYTEQYAFEDINATLCRKAQTKKNPLPHTLVSRVDMARMISVFLG